MTREDDTTPRPSDVAGWHERSGLPDNVTDEGVIVPREPGRQLSADKAALRGAIARLREGDTPQAAQNLARLAASYLLAGDLETARRYVARAERVARGGR